MIVVDTSAVFACLIGEAEADELFDVMYRADALLMGAPTRLELTIATYRRAGSLLQDRSDRLIDELGIEVAAFGSREDAIARGAFLRFGKGTGHPAQLNYGDCMSYAIAKARGLPLLFKGDDFRRTDIVAAL